jgi:putative membrane protein
MMNVLLTLAQSGAPSWLQALGQNLLTAGVYTVFGVIVFAIAFVTMTKLTPFSVRKEIEEDQNTSLAIIMGSVVIGLAIIIAAAVHG